MPIAPGLFKYASIKIATVEYAQYATTAELTGETPTQQIRTLVPSGLIVDIDSAAWNFHLVGMNDTALYTALRAAQGTTVNVVFQEVFGSGQTVATFSVVVPALPLGGSQGAWRQFDVNMPVNGQPVFTTSA